jgi:hypothetical protein
MRQIAGPRDLPIIRSIPPDPEQPVNPKQPAHRPRKGATGVGVSGDTKKGGYAASTEELHARYNQTGCNVAAKFSHMENVLREGRNGLIVDKMILSGTATVERDAVLSMPEQQDNRKTTGWFSQSLLRRTNYRRKSLW